MLKAVEAIPGKPLPHGILGGCADIRDVTDVHELLGVEWLALGCCPVNVWHDPCLDDEESPGDESPGEPARKEFCRPRAEHAEPITVYAGAECSALGSTYAEARAHAQASLLLGEQGAVEAGFWTNTLAMAAADLTPREGPVHIAEGVARLEAFLAETYGGQGVLHVPTGGAALLSCYNLVHQDQATGTLRTLAGNGVVVGAGYSAMNTGPGNLPAPPGTTWLYATGPLVIRRGPAETLPDQPGPSVNTGINDRRVLVERTYVVATTCTVSAVHVVTRP
ncbi:cupin [Streptomyces sp. HPF1205]|uniref:cupin n=1 Tax=Streptomyces sp. HPF1205 TaxID=2873262 RepID=UPI001CED6D4F|nr:cupin [Streptomyces sp. HPF1205]